MSALGQLGSSGSRRRMTGKGRKPNFKLSRYRAICWVDLPIYVPDDGQNFPYRMASATHYGGTDGREVTDAAHRPQDRAPALAERGGAFRSRRRTPSRHPLREARDTRRAGRPRHHACADAPSGIPRRHTHLAARREHENIIAERGEHANPEGRLWVESISGPAGPRLQGDVRLT